MGFTHWDYISLHFAALSMLKICQFLDLNVIDTRDVSSIDFQGNLKA